MASVGTCFTKTSLLPILLGVQILLTATSANAQQTDRVEVVRGAGRSASGKITQITPYEVTIQASDGLRTISAEQISKVIYQGQPLEIERARSQMNGGRFDGAIEELQKISESPKREEIRQEIDFLIAKSNAEIAFRSGPLTPQDAGRGLADFLKNHPQSYHYYPAVELLGRLYFALGKFDLAEKEFEKLKDSRWQEYLLKGNFYRGESLIEQGKLADAGAAFDAILALDKNDDLTQTYKLLARTRSAKTQAMNGNPDEAIRTLEDLIRVEDANNSLLFAYAYNSLGAAYLHQNNLKEAMMAFLHTDLLYGTTERDAHAEALYNLAQIWPKLDQLERANRARQNLKTAYRNSVWAMKLQ
jgi:tetratricopeptide (TPR) repeat protein